MRSPMSSNLVRLIEKAIDDCFYNGEARVDQEERCNMSEMELQRLYDILEHLTDENEIAALRHAIFIIESNNCVY